MMSAQFVSPALLLFLCRVAAADEVASARTAFVVVDRARLRLGAETIAEIPLNSSVRLLEERGDWIGVKAVTLPEKPIGWLHSSEVAKLTVVAESELDAAKRTSALKSVSLLATPNAALPPWERWEIRFSELSTSELAMAMDFYDLELGILSVKADDDLVSYARDVSQDKPKTRVGERSRERRMYFAEPSQENGPFKRVLSAADIAVESGSVVICLFPDHFLEMLIAVEGKFADREARDILRTVFRIRRKSGGFEAFVFRQEVVERPAAQDRDE